MIYQYEPSIKRSGCRDTLQNDLCHDRYKKVNDTLYCIVMLYGISIAYLDLNKKRLQHFLKGGKMMKKYLVVLTSLLLMFGMIGIAQADTITLNGTIRDFNAGGHFEATIDGLVKGLVANTLGADKNPVRTTKTTASMPGDLSLFNQWYNDVAGVNMAASLPIILDNGGAGNVYTYSNSSFFPIDGQLLGNEGRAHNFHFTYELHTNFTYQGGETFNFAGDDDLWVFINNQLVVDLGGIHSVVTGGVNLDTLGLTVGNNYDFDLFFAERHTTQSNFRIDTSIALQPNPVPIPAAVWLLGSGLLGLVGLRRKFKK